MARMTIVLFTSLFSNILPLHLKAVHGTNVRPLSSLLKYAAQKFNLIRNADLGEKKKKKIHKKLYIIYFNSAD